MKEHPMVVFVTTCRGRVHHLKETLPRNLADNESFPHCKFVVLDYGSPDDLVDYLSSEQAGPIATGKLVVYSFPDANGFRMAHAKNMAHRCGMMEGADILVNLDADNFTGEGFAEYVAKAFSYPGIFLWSRMIPGVLKRGVSGRIAVKIADFLKLGGYDEVYETYGPDDKDFNARLTRFGLTPVEIPKEYLVAIHHGHKLRYKEYPHAKAANEDVIETIDQEKTIVNFGRIGSGTVYRNFGTDPIELKPLPTRIFGIGFQKTATTSLCAALNILGLDCAHWKSPRWARNIWEEIMYKRMTEPKGHLTLVDQDEARPTITLEKNYSLCDFPIATLFWQLDCLYPGSKFILTIRNEDAWLKSVRNHWAYDRNPWRASWDTDCFSHRMHRLVYGRKDFDAETFVNRYRRHNADVRAYFKDRPEDLLVLNIDGNPGWSRLCEFLGKPVPDADYPVEFVTTRSQ